MNVRAKRVFKKLNGVMAIAVLAALIVLGAVTGVCGKLTEAQAIGELKDENEKIYTNYKPQSFEFDLEYAKANGYVNSFKLNLGNNKAETKNADGKYVRGDFYSEDVSGLSGQLIYTHSTVDKVDRWSMNSIPQTYMRADLPVGEVLRSAIADPMVDVTVKAYFRFGNWMTSDGADESFQYDIGLYAKNKDNTFKSLSRVSGNMQGINGQMNPNEVKYGSVANKLPSVSVDGDLYFSVCYNNFKQGGSQCRIPILEMGLYIECASGSSVGIDDPEIEVFDVSRTSNSTSATDNYELNNVRNASANDNEVKAGDVLIIRNKVLYNNGNPPVSKDSTYKQDSQGKDVTDKNVGYLYRKLFLPSDTSHIFGYNFNNTELERIYTFSYVHGEGENKRRESYDLRNDYSGSEIILRVTGNNWYSTNVKVFISDYNGNENPTDSMQPINIKLYADNAAATKPELDNAAKFTEKYIGRNGKYYTDEESYVKENIKGENNQYTEKVVAIDLLKAKTALKPTFSADSLTPRGADAGVDGTTYKTSQSIYYKVTMLPYMPGPTESTNSGGFKLSESTGVCYTTLSDGLVDSGDAGKVLPGDLKLSLVTDGNNNLVYDVKQALDNNVSLTFHDNAVYCIEFITVDYVGNASSGIFKYYIKVDIRDYEFNYKTLIGAEEGNENNEMSQYDVKITFSTLTDDNKEIDRGTKTSFKRGDRVIVKSTLGENSQFILANFSVGSSISFPISDTSREVKIKQSGETYTFEVSSAFSQNADSRKIVLIYKKQVAIEVDGVVGQTNITKTYTGSSVGVQGRAKTKDTDEYILGTNVVTKYAVEGGEYSTIQPINAGTYSYKCELTDHSVYYAIVSGTLEIRPATPQLNGVRATTLDYGQSLAIIDFDDTLSVHQINDQVSAVSNLDGYEYHDRSSDGIFGYFRLSGFDKNDDSYKKHAASDGFKVTVEFVPIKCKIDETTGSVLITDGKPAYIRENGKFVRDTNYAIAKTQINVKINRSTAVDITVNDEIREEETESGETVNVIYHTYDGTAKPIDFGILSGLRVDDVTVSTTINGIVTTETKPLDLSSQTRVRYRRENVSTYLGEPPTDVGRYLVFLDIPSGNYTASMQFVIVIEKKQLRVECDKYTFVYQKQTEPLPVAKEGEGSSAQHYYGRNYTLVYYACGDDTKKAGEDDFSFYNRIVKKGDIVSEGDYFINRRVPAEAGTYVVKISLNEANFENESDAYTTLTITKVTSTTENLSFTQASPTFNSSDRSAHIDYLQPLSNVVLDVSRAGVIYTFSRFENGSVVTRPRNVEGRFYVASRRYRDAEHPTETVSEFLQSAVEDAILPIGSQLAYIYFIASGADANNFEPISATTATSIVVGKTKLDFGAVRIENIIYGQSVKDASDLTISKDIRYVYKTVDGVPQYKKLFDAEKKFGEDAAGQLEKANYENTFGYSYKLNFDEAQIFPAGSRYIDVTVVPKSSELYDGRTLTYSCLLTIEKKELDISVKSQLNDEGYFEFAYGLDVLPEFIFTADGVDIKDVGGSAEYYLENNDAAVLAPLPVGRYRGVFSVVSDNYTGEIAYKINVVKAKLAVSTMPTILDPENEVSFNRLIGDVRLANGVMVNSNTSKVVDGAFVFDYPSGTRFSATGITKAYLMKFIPVDIDNYEVFEYVNEAQGERFSMLLTVSKANISDTMTLTAAAKTYGEVRFDVNPYTLIEYSTSVYYKDTVIDDITVREYSAEKAEGFEYLPVVVSVSNLPASGYINAGTYSVKAEIDDENYRGSVTADWKIAKKRVEIAVEASGAKKVYTGQSQNVTNRVLADGEEIRVTVTQAFYSGGQRLNGAPSAIGKYQAVLNVVSNNYESDTLTLDFIIGVNEKSITVNNLIQVYGAPRAVAVSLGSNRAQYTVYYKSIPDNPGDVTQIYDELPTEAGEYEVILSFPEILNNGYFEEITFKNHLVIEQSSVTITVSERVVVEYTGRSHTIRAVTNPYGLNLKVEYCREGETEFSSEEILSANTGDGYHQVRFTVVDKNYRGEAIVEYVIRPATLTAVESPVFESTYYRSTVHPELVTPGKVNFGVQTDIKGKYTLDLNEVSKLSAGTHRVVYTFVALKEDGVTEDSNFAKLIGQTYVTVMKQRVSPTDFIIGSVSGATGEYNGKSFSVDVSLRDGVIYNRDTDNAELEIRTYYNNGLNLPRDPGEYIVRAEIFSLNYTGEAVWEQVFTVTKGKPEIAVKPTLRAGKTFNIGDTVADSDLTGGKAVVNGTDTLLEGSFKLTAVRPFEKANYNNVEMVFTPTNAFFLPVNFTVSIFVEGENILRGVTSGEAWDGDDGEGKPINVEGYGTVRVRAFSANTVYYGSPLSSFRVEFYGDDRTVNYLNSFGVLDFTDNDAILSVGERAKVSFTPLGKNADVYSIVYGYIKVDIEKARLPEVNCQLKSVDDEPRLIVTNTDGSLRDDKGAVLKIYADAGRTQEIVGAELKNYRNKTVYFVLQMNDYEDLLGSAAPQIAMGVTDKQIVVANVSKSYDGGAITVKDLGVTVRDLPSGVPVVDGDIYIRVFKDGREISGAAASGDYTVRIYLDNAQYYGEKEIAFTVTKADISEKLKMSFTRVTYGKFPSNPTVSVDGVTLPTALYSLEYKPFSASDSSYTVNKPINAGEYKLRIKIAENNENYIGIKVFDFTVEKQILRLNAKSEYEYDYGKAELPLISFLRGDSQDAVTVEREDYTMLFYSPTYSLSTDIPENAGDYKVRIQLDTLNYILGSNGYVELTYRINKMSVTVTTVPVPSTLSEGGNVYNLKYGQALKELSFTGGVASRLDEPVGGRFTVKDPDVRPSIGSGIIKLVFIPSNSNYATAECEAEIYVAPADATVYFDSLRVPYIGSGTKQSLTYRVEPEGVRINITFINKYNETITDPVEAGSYSLKVESADKNYRVVSLLEGDNKIEPVFIVEKAAAEYLNMPKTTPISVGDNLSKTTITGGEDYGFVRYKNFSKPIPGRFVFDEQYRTFTTAGSYYLDFTFIPDDTLNFAQVSRKANNGEGILLTVNKAEAAITVTDTEFVYSEGFKLPTFKTAPKDGLKLEHNITWREYDPTDPSYIPNSNDIIEVGSYDFEVWVSEEEENYTSSRIRFSLTIRKKTLDMDFRDEDGNAVKQYVMTYGKNAVAAIKLYPNGTDGKRGYLLQDEYKGGVFIGATYELLYRSTDGESYIDARAPTDIGSYTVTATLVNNNYAATATTVFRINTGKIEKIEFDEDLLEKQVYGSVMPPRITTTPANVNYYIVYQGTGMSVPRDAGSYNMTVYFDDPNYEKRQVSAMFKVNRKKINVSEITVDDKIYDGVSNLNVNGKLLDVHLGDEVFLTLTAATANKDVSVGYHYVDITSYKIYGLQSTNYELIPPVYTRTVYIAPVRVDTPSGNSFITSTTGFNVGTTVEFTKISSKKGSSSFFENITGRTSEIIGYTLKENGADVLIDKAFKVYIEIPAEYRDVEFEVTGLGALEGQPIIFSREGNFITFYATSSGQVAFKKTEFKYGTVVLISAVSIAVVGIIVLLVLVPLQHRRKFASDAEKDAVKKIKKGM